MASLRDMVYGAAIGDALGVPYEFRGRDSFTCTGMATGGAHNQPAGTFSDDTSMLLATCDSIRELGRIDCADMRAKFLNWLYRGEYAVAGNVFDMGITVSKALNEGHGLTGERDNGNGSLMRIAPLAFTDATDDEIRSVSAITHGHVTSTDSCVRYVRLAQALNAGFGLNAALAQEAAYPGWEWLRDVPFRSQDDVHSGGYVIDTLCAAIWCLANTTSYAECVLAAVNLGSDTDTTACVAGALAGIVYGYDAIPHEWLETLRGKDIIERCLF